jgi:predicted ABC-type ATPase
MRSVANLHKASRIVDEGYVYDNSSKCGFRLLAEKIDGQWVIGDRSMPWLTDGLLSSP